MKLSEGLDGIGRPVAYYPGLRKITGSTTATIIFCQLYYWRGKEKQGADGWIYKSADELEEETGLSYVEQKIARKTLKAKGLLLERYERLKHRMYYKIDLDMLDKLWDIWHVYIPERSDNTMGSVLPLDSLTETTAKTTNKEDPSFSKSENESPSFPLQSNEEQQEQTDYLAKGTNHNLEHDDYPEPEMVEVPGEFEPTLPPPPPAKVAKKIKAKSGRNQMDTPEEVQIIAALADVTNINPKTGHYLLKPAAQNLLADERVCPEVIRRDYGKDGAWYKKHWKGKRGDHPSTKDVMETMLTWGETETDGVKDIQLDNFYAKGK